MSAQAGANMLVWILPACVLVFVFLYLWTRIPSKKLEVSADWPFQSLGEPWHPKPRAGGCCPGPTAPPRVHNSHVRHLEDVLQSSCRREGKRGAVLTESLCPLSGRPLWSQQKFPSAFWGHGHISHCGFSQSRATELILLRSSQLFYQGVFRRK